MKNDDVLHDRTRLVQHVSLMSRPIDILTVLLQGLKLYYSTLFVIMETPLLLLFPLNVKYCVSNDNKIKGL